LFIVALATVWVFEHVAERRHAKTVFAAATVLVLVALSAVSIRQMQKWHDGVTLWGSVIEQEPRRIPFAYYNRGVAYQMAGDTPSAIQDFSTAILLSRETAEERQTVSAAYNNRGIAYDQIGQHDLAISDFSSAVSLQPEFFEAYANRGIGYKGKGEYDRALEDFTRALAINPQYEPAYYNRAVVFYLKGEFEKARADIGKAFELDPGNPKVLVLQQSIDLRLQPGAPAERK
jgi:tetratricopeptide (TPR) repeat protein